MNSVSKKVTKITIFGIKIDYKLTFSSHFKNLCIKAYQNLCAYLRIPNYYDQHQKTFCTGQ